MHILHPIKYNPFKSWSNDLEDRSNSNDDQFYDTDLTDTFDNIYQLSTILDNCKYTSKAETKEKMTNANFKTLFYNIDGIRTNFDTFVAEISTITELSVIGLAETNIDAKLSNHFQLDNYNSHFNDTVGDKVSGTGVALYIHESLNATRIKSMCTATDNIETLFMEVNLDGVTTVNAGVVYRPPSGSKSKFINEYTTLLKNLNLSKTTYVLGDFNIDLLTKNSDMENFEQTFLSHGLFPLISQPTHKRDNCKPSCIDNIFTNSTETIICSGLIEDMGKEHFQNNYPYQ